MEKMIMIEQLIQQSSKELELLEFRLAHSEILSKNASMTSNSSSLKNASPLVSSSPLINPNSTLINPSFVESPPPPPPPPPPMKMVKDDPRYAPFFKLLKMGAHRLQIEQRMKTEGLDTSLLDSPDAPAPE